MYLIQIGQRYFNARGGYFGRLGSRIDATQFSPADATDRAARMGATVVAA